MTRFLRSRPTLGVKSVPASLEFYEQAVGFTPLTTMGEPPTFAIVGPGVAGLGLAQVDSPAVGDLACCYFNVEGVEELHQRCVDAGRGSRTRLPANRGATTTSWSPTRTGTNSRSERYRPSTPTERR
jgi:hypothetical protein